MKAIEALYNNPTQIHNPIDTVAFWNKRAPLLAERGVNVDNPLDYIREQIEARDETVWGAPDSLFDPNGGDALPLRHTHILLSVVLDSPDQPFKVTLAKEIYPYWIQQLNDLREIQGTL